jgi:GT2 family glycosyltransferase
VSAETNRLPVERAAPKLIDVSGVVATAARSASLKATLENLARQGAQPREIVVVDASEDLNTRRLCEMGITGLCSDVRWIKAAHEGAAAQRNQGVTIAQEVIWFFDDDVIFEEDCVARLFHGLQSEAQLGGVSAMIVNQSYRPPGFVSRTMFTLMHGRREKSYAGRVIGPAINLLPEDREDLPEVVPMEWLNTTCTMYRRGALPSPPFDPFFTGYSLMEDLALSLRVSQRGWRLANVRSARIVHRSQAGQHKADVAAIASMELRNRRYVMTEVLKRRSFSDYVRLSLWECFTIASSLANRDGFRNLPKVLAGKLHALFAPRSSGATECHRI